MNALCTAPSRAVRNPTTRGESCGFVDESYGPARALRAVWTARGQRGRVAHRLPTLSRLSPTSSTGPTTGDSHTTTPHNPSPRLPPPTVQDNICLPLKPIPTSPTAWLTPNPSGSFPYGIRLGNQDGLCVFQSRDWTCLHRESVKYCGQVRPLKNRVEGRIPCQRSRSCSSPRKMSILSS